MASENAASITENTSRAASEKKRLGWSARTPALPTDLNAEQVAFVKGMQRRTRLRAATRDKYARNVARFLSWLAEARDPGAPDSDPFTGTDARDRAVRDYLAYLKTVRTDRGTRLTPATINNRLAAIECFFLLRGLGRPRVDREDATRRTAPRVLDERQLTRFLRIVERDAAVRDRAICHLAYYAGLRVSEIVALDVEDVRITARRVDVRGKGRNGKDRVVPMQSTLRATLEALLEEAGRPESGPVFRNVRGTRLSTRTASTIIAVLGRAAGLESDDHGEPFGPHVLRHTFGTQLVRSGKTDIWTVAELMGHSCPATTQQYELPTDADRGAAVDAPTADE